MKDTTIRQEIQQAVIVDMSAQSEKILSEQSGKIPLKAKC